MVSRIPTSFSFGPNSPNRETEARPLTPTVTASVHDPVNDAVTWLQAGIYRFIRELEAAPGLTEVLVGPESAPFWDYFGTDHDGSDTVKRDAYLTLIRAVSRQLDCDTHADLLARIHFDPELSRMSLALSPILITFLGDEICHTAITDCNTLVLNAVIATKPDYFDSSEIKSKYVHDIIIQMGKTTDTHRMKELCDGLAIVDAESARILNHLNPIIGPDSMQDLNAIDTAIETLDHGVRYSRYLTQSIFQFPIYQGGVSLVNTLFKNIYAPTIPIDLKAKMALLMLHLCERLGDSLVFKHEEKTTLSHVNIMLGLYEAADLPIDSLLASGIDPILGHSSRVYQISNLFIESAFLLRPDYLKTLTTLIDDRTGNILSTTSGGLTAFHMALLGFRTKITDNPALFDPMLGRLKETIQTLGSIAALFGEPQQSLQDLLVTCGKPKYTFSEMLDYIIQEPTIQPHSDRVREAVIITGQVSVVEVNSVDRIALLGWDENVLLEVDGDPIWSARINAAIDEYLVMFPKPILGESAILLNTIFESELFAGLRVSGSDSPILTRLGLLNEIQTFDPVSYTPTPNPEHVFPPAYPWSYRIINDYLAVTPIPDNQPIVRFPAMDRDWVAIRSDDHDLYRVGYSRGYLDSPGPSVWRVIPLSDEKAFVLVPRGTGDRSTWFLEAVRALHPGQYSLFNQVNNLGLTVLDPVLFQHRLDGASGVGWFAATPRGVLPEWGWGPFETKIPTIQGTWDTCWIEPLLNQEALSLRYSIDLGDESKPYIYSLAQRVIHANIDNAEPSAWVAFFKAYVDLLDTTVLNAVDAVDIRPLAFKYVELARDLTQFQPGFGRIINISGGTGFNDTHELVCRLSAIAVSLIPQLDKSEQGQFGLIKVADKVLEGDLGLRFGLHASVQQRYDEPRMLMMALDANMIAKGGTPLVDAGFLGDMVVALTKDRTKYPDELLIGDNSGAKFNQLRYIKHNSGHLVICWQGVSYVIYGAHVFDRRGAHWLSVFTPVSRLDISPIPYVKHANGQNAERVDGHWELVLNDLLVRSDSAFLRCRKCEVDLVVPEELKTALDAIRGDLLAQIPG